VGDLKPQWFSPELCEGVVGYSGAYFYPAYGKSGKTVTISGIFTKWISGSTLFILPEGFRPRSSVYSPTLLTDAMSVKGYCMVCISSSGDISPIYGAPGPSTHPLLHISATFIIAI
jgi:hypothetical protein